MIGTVAGLPSARAQDESPERVIAKAKLYYDSGRYQDAFNELVALLSQRKELKPKLLVDIYKYLGFCYSAYDRRDLAKKQFKTALMYDPSLELDPVFTSPKIMQVFQEAKTEFERERPKIKRDQVPKGVQKKAGEPAKGVAAPSDRAAAPRVEVRTVSPGSAVFRSLLIPGWGQFYTRHPVKGGLFIGGVVTTLALAINYKSKSVTAQEYYYEAGPGEREEVWEDAEKFNLLGNVFYAMTALVWIGGGVDAIFSAKSTGRTACVTPYFSRNPAEPPALGITCHAQF